jgi:DNA-binding GntR family transcriptional regulator
MRGMKSYMTKLPSNKNTLRVEAYKEIKSKIICLHLKPGEKIFENEIAKSLKISRTPVREALLILENEKLVECDERLGFVVKRLNTKEVEEYFSIRKAFEAFAAPFIIERITASEIAELKENVMEAQGYLKVNDFNNIVRCETKFHEILWRATKSEIFFQIISGLSDKFQWIRAIALSAQGGCRESIDDHKKIVALIEEKDSKKLKKFIALHIDHSRKKYALTQGLYM